MGGFICARAHKKQRSFLEIMLSVRNEQSRALIT